MIDNVCAVRRPRDRVIMVVCKMSRTALQGLQGGPKRHSFFDIDKCISRILHRES